MLTELQAWAQSRVGPADSKAERLVAELLALCKSEGVWNDERVVVFTEYRDTQVWLAGLLNARGLGGDRLGLLYGGHGHPRSRTTSRRPSRPAPTDTPSASC